MNAIARYATQGARTKAALIRRPGYPVGQPAPLFLVCNCGRELDVTEAGARCEACETTFSPTGWVL